MSLDLYCATSQAQYRKMVILRSASANTTKGGEDTFNSSSMESKRDSLCHSADGSQESESDTSSDSGTSEDQRSNENSGSTSAEESSDHQFDFPFEFPDEKRSKANTNRASVQLRTEIRMASLPVRNEVFDSGPRARIYVASYVTRELS